MCPERGCGGLDRRRGPGITIEFTSDFGKSDAGQAVLPIPRIDSEVLQHRTTAVVTHTQVEITDDRATQARLNHLRPGRHCRVLPLDRQPVQHTPMMRRDTDRRRPGRHDDRMSIREIHIGAYNDGEQQYDPPERVLNVAVIGKKVFLDIQPCDEHGTLGEAEARVQVPARSLLRALQALIEDDEDETVK